MGVKVTSDYWTLGYFDGVIIFDAPDGETAAAAMIQLSGQGHVHTTTSRAFQAERNRKGRRAVGEVAPIKPD